jgi:glycerol kinase
MPHALICRMQMPINDDTASSLMIGMSLETKKGHIVRALLESLAFRFALLHQTVLNETTTPLSNTIKSVVLYSDSLTDQIEWICYHSLAR